MPEDKRKPPQIPPSRKKEPEPAAADEPVGTPHPFDVKTIEVLIRFMGENHLTEIDLRDGNKRVRLSKAHPAMSGAPFPSLPYPPPPHAPSAPPPAHTPTPPPAAPAKALLEIKSELIGTYYAKPKPDKDDYVKVGSRVTADTVVCQIEAMKIFNEIRAGIAGIVTEVCVKNGEPVEYNKVLFRVDPG